jgi:hypothetical protein
VPISNGQSSK